MISFRNQNRKKIRSPCWDRRQSCRVYYYNIIVRSSVCVRIVSWFIPRPRRGRNNNTGTRIGATGGWGTRARSARSQPTRYYVVEREVQWSTKDSEPSTVAGRQTRAADIGDSGGRVAVYTAAGGSLYGVLYMCTWNVVRSMFARCVRRRTWPSHGTHINAGGRARCLPVGRSAGWLRHRPPPPVTLIGTRDIHIMYYFFFFALFFSRSGVLLATTAGTIRHTYYVHYFIFFHFFFCTHFIRGCRVCVSL